MITPTPNPQQTWLMCRCLRAKEMFYQNAIGDEDRLKNSNFWCLKTQEVFGPDGQVVNRKECSPDRPCYSE